MTPLPAATITDTPRSDDAVASDIALLYATEQTVRRQLLHCVAEYIRREAYRADGATSMEQWLMESLSITRSHAAELVRVATKLEGLPSLSAAYSAGELSWDQLLPVVSVADPDNDLYLAGEAPKYSAEQCKQMAHQMRRVSAADATAAHRGRFLRWWWDDQCLRLSGRLADTDGAMVAKALTHLAEHCRSEDRDSADDARIADATAADATAADATAAGYEDFTARCADALVQLASSYLELSEDADRATLVVHADATALLGEDGEARLDDGPDIALQSLRRLACDVRWQLMAERPDGQAVGVGRITRSVPGWLSRQLKRRDGGCRFPGCGRTRWLHAHHLIHWADGGPTDPDNLVMLCGTHHRTLHEEGWKTSGAPAALHFLSPTGRHMTSHPSPRRPEVRSRLRE